MCPSVSPLGMSVNSPRPGMGRSFNFLLEASVFGKMQEARATSFQRGQASRSLLVLDDFSDATAANKFGSLMLSLIVCV